MFNKELFYSLCEKYQVELSDKFETAMIKDGEVLKRLNEDEVKKVFPNFKTYFSYEKSGIKTKSKSLSSFEVLEYLIAC